MMDMNTLIGLAGIPAAVGLSLVSYHWWLVDTGRMNNTEAETTAEPVVWGAGND